MALRDVRYEGQQRQTTFAQNQVELPDEAKKIQAEAADQVRRMEKQRQAILDNRNAYQKGIHDKNYLERQNREKNFNFQTTVDQKYHEAELKRSQQEIKNIETRSKNEQRFWKDIEGFSESATKFAKALDTKIGNDAKAYGKYLTHKYGLSAQDLLYLDKANRHVEAFSTANNAVIENLKLKGISDQDLNAIRNLSGRTLLGAQIYAVSTMGENIGQHYDRLSAKPITIQGHGEVTLAQIERGGIGDPAVHKQVFDQLTLQLYKDLEENEGTAGYSGKFLAQHLSPGIEREWKNRAAKYRTKSSEIHAVKYEEEERVNTLAAIKGEGSAKAGLALFNLVDERSGGYSENRTYHWNKVGDHVKNAISSGELKEDIITQIENTWIDVPGQGMKRFADFKPEIVGTWRQALIARAKQEENAQDLHEKNYSNERRIGFKAQVVRMGRYATTEEIQLLKDQFIERGYEIPQWLEEADKYEEYIDEIGEDRIKLLIGQGLWTEEEMANGKYSENLLAKYRKQVQNGPSSASKDIVTGQVNGIKAAIAKAGSQLAVDPNQRNYEVNALSGIAVSRLRTKVAASLRNNLYESADEAWIQEGLQLQKDIEAGVGDWSLKKLGDSDQIDLKGGFEYFSGPKQLDKVAVDMTKAVRDDNDIIHTKEFYPEAEIKATDSIARTKKVPNWAISVASAYKDLDPYDIINQGRMLHGLEPLKVPGYPKIDARFKAWVNHKPSLNKTAAALALTQKLHEPDADPYEAIRGHIRTKYAMADETHGGYDSMDSGAVNGGFGVVGGTTGTQVFQTPLIEMPVSAVLELQNQNRLGGAGAYGLSSDIIDQYIAKGLITPDSVFDKATQDLLADQIIHEKTGSFIVSGDGAREALMGLGREFPGLIGEDQVFDERERAGGYQALLDSIDSVREMGIEPQRLRPDLQIRVKKLLEKYGEIPKPEPEPTPEPTAEEPVTQEEATEEAPKEKLSKADEVFKQVEELEKQNTLGKVNEVLNKAHEDYLEQKREERKQNQGPPTWNDPQGHKLPPYTPITGKAKIPLPSQEQKDMMTGTLRKRTVKEKEANE